MEREDTCSKAFVNPFKFRKQDNRVLNSDAGSDNRAFGELPGWNRFWSIPQFYEVRMNDLFQPTPEHQAIRRMVRDFVVAEVAPQAEEHDRTESFNLELFRALGSLGLLGITIPEQYGGSGFDAVSAVIVHEELSAADPGFCLAYLAHSMLFVNNF